MIPYIEEPERKHATRAEAIAACRTMVVIYDREFSVWWIPRSYGSSVKCPEVWYVRNGCCPAKSAPNMVDSWMVATAAKPYYVLRECAPIKTRRMN